MKTEAFYRAFDANLNRAREGLRVLEDIARFVLEDATLADRARTARHALKLPPDIEYGPILEARSVPGDFGIKYSSEYYQGQVSVVIANARRVQEAARVLEETARILNLDSVEDFKRLRYTAYDLEQDFVQKFRHVLKSSFLNNLKLYVIVGSEHTASRSVADITREAIRGGAEMVQLREKNLPSKAFLETAQALREVTRNAGIPLIINDRADIAAAAAADGVHLGQDDLPVGAARRLLGEHAVIGVSTHSLSEAVDAEKDGADYIGFGPVFATPTKPDLEPLGTERLREVLQVVRVPVVAIGGIGPDNIGKVVAAGAQRVAVVSAVTGTPDVTANARLLHRILEGSR
ncbi:MAG: thiamine phosphate synthase [Bacillota bacterium]